MSYEEVKPKGAPRWMTTYADLVTLLLCFFVFLFSYSELDRAKFDKITDSIKLGLGMNNPAKSSLQANNQSNTSLRSDDAIFEAQQLNKNKVIDDPLFLFKDEKNSVIESFKQQLEFELAALIEQDLAEVALVDGNLVVRLRNSGFFASGSSFIQPQATPFLKQLANSLSDIAGKVVIAGHTDDLKVIDGSLHEDNWALSQARAKSVFDVMTTDTRLNKNRLKLEAHADTYPLEPNVNENNRARNRRVEVILQSNQQNNELNDG